MEKTLLTPEQKEFYIKNGYLHLKSVFSPEEIQTFRKAALNDAKQSEEKNFALNNPQGGKTTVDLLSHNTYNKFILKKEVIDILRELLEDDPVYFGVSCLSISYYKRTIHSHRDNINYDDPNGDDWKDNFSIIRTGIYLEDHVDDGGNIWFNPGSHKSFKSGGRPQTFDYKAGDLVIWSLLTVHSVSALPRKTLGSRQVPTIAEVLYFRLIKPFITRPLPTTAYPPEKQPRVFMTAIYGANSDKRNVERIITRRNHKQWNWKYAIFNNTKHYDDNALSLAKQQGLNLKLNHILDKSKPYEIIN